MASTSGFFETVESVFSDWTYGHPLVLYSLIRLLKPDVVCEVGTYRGYAACYMARAIQENGKGRLYCIDDFSEATQRPCSASEWRGNLEKCGVTATLLCGKSEEVEWPDRVDFAYIDGWHGSKTCLADFENCAKRGAELIALDDLMTVGPRLVAAHARQCGYDVIEMYRGHGLAICKKTTPRPHVDYSQESPESPGVVLATEEERISHFAEAHRQSGLVMP